MRFCVPSIPLLSIGGAMPGRAVRQFGMALFLLVLGGTALAGEYDSRSWRQKPRAGLSEKSRKGIARALKGGEADKGGQTAKSGRALGDAKAETERYRLEQEQAAAQMLDYEYGDEAMPDYRMRAIEAYRYTGDRNVKRFAEAVSEFQMQELRERALENIGDPEKFNRYMAIISGRQYAPYANIRDSGYVVNRSTGEISVGNRHTAGMHDGNVRADTARKNAGAADYHARARERAERSASGASSSAARQKTAASPGMTAAEYQQARAKAMEADRPDLVKELDAVARYMGYAN